MDIREYQKTRLDCDNILTAMFDFSNPLRYARSELHAKARCDAKIKKNKRRHQIPKRVGISGPTKKNFVLQNVSK